LANKEAGFVLFVSYVLGVLAIAVAIPIVILCIEIFSALTLGARKHFSYPARPAAQNIAVVIPAHNEGSGISSTLNAISPQLRGGDRLLVVADNCSDDTANISSASGAEVIERRDLNRQGKGYALDFGLRFLEKNPPNVVIFIDADCRTSDDAIEQMVRTCIATGRPVQILDLMTAPEVSSINYRVAEFAWRVRNWVRPLGLAAMDLPCPLMGTGMAFPWDVICSANLATGALTEDRKIGVALTRAGYPPLFCPGARVTSHFPLSSEGAKTQRQRWEEGNIRTLFGEAPRFSAVAIRTGNFPLFALSLDAMVPPLSLLAMLAVGLLLLTGAATFLGASALPFTISVIALLALIAAVALAWLKYGRDVLPVTSIFSIAGYALGKLPLYRQIFSRRGTSSWVRTDRGKP
jgi:cellulose synthase/poly-beta-1,6-N-acetylglucosamine synthase-like glycosyltransferase